MLVDWQIAPEIDGIKPIRGQEILDIMLFIEKNVEMLNSLVKMLKLNITID